MTMETSIYYKYMYTQQGLLNVPFWVYWTSPYNSHLVDHIPNGWVM